MDFYLVDIYLNIVGWTCNVNVANCYYVTSLFIWII